MPFQSVVSLGIIAGAFMTMGGLLRTINYMYEGKRERPYNQDYFSHRLASRDQAIKQVWGSNID